MSLSSKRSSFLTAGTAAFGTIGFVRSPARAAQYTLKIGTPDGGDFPVTVGIVQMARALRDESHGRVELQVYDNSSLGSPNSMLSQVRLGSLEMTALNFSLFASLVPVAQVNGLGFAFSSAAQALSAFDGPLGAYIRNQLAAKDMYVFPLAWDAGFKQIETTSKPLRTAEDFVGVRLRSVPAAISVELFRVLGASPIPLESNEMYPAMQTHIVDGIDDSLDAVDGHKFWDVLKYVAMTNHGYSGYWMAANANMWKALPPDIQALISRSADKYIRAERSASRTSLANTINRLKGHGMVFNSLDLAAVRARLGPYYTHWKSEFGPTVWGLLEGAVGKLV